MSKKKEFFVSFLRKTDRIIIRCNTPEFLSGINQEEFLGKEYHLSSVVTEIAAQRNKIIKRNEILLLDDDVKNILIAEEFGHKVLEIRDGINLDILKEFVYNVLPEC
jgi:predicted phosphatase